MDENNTIVTDDIVEKIKELVKKGNVARILVKRNDTTVLNIPLNAGIAGAVIGISAAPLALIGSAIAAIGLDCKVELVKNDGSTITLLSREVGSKAFNAGASILNRFKGE